ncbi:unnamed protein product [Penicillium salamii]|uniref:Uncharacterized protein n=1 Tax=Penicillium salamii TaxID=1612424 RepID=A0A9W4NAE1_9EURO|nr:unnamed protein product [Penicillium salamii]CAG8120661.1 unnamed protein product [Penicillium salamii]CAG8291205.1 unnamed protein product [Penicillium salamii]CAG8343300.1 unnamed protein product [Penicillium salamii]CAG8345139.1 unnamed protein product [Penicillium salamii]
MSLVIILHATATVIVLALSSSAIWKAFRWTGDVHIYDPLPDTSHQDEDSGASADFQETSATSQRVVTFTASAYTTLGILKPVTLFATFKSSPFSEVLAVINGISLLAHGLSLRHDTDITCRYQNGVKGAWAWTMTGISCFAGIYEDLTDGRISGANRILALSSILMISLGIGGNLSFPQRPKVFRNSHLVDDQYTTSILGQITFSWATYVIQSVKAKGKYLVIDDIPEMGDHARAETLRESFREARSGGVPLWKAILRVHRGVFVRQMVLTIAVCFLSIVPSLALFQILRTLETPAESAQSSWLWLNVALLAAGVLLSCTLDTWKFWFSYNCLSLRTFEQLSIAVFEKSMRLPTACVFSDSGSDPQDTGDGMNLLAVDAKYVADSLCSSYVMYQAPLQIIISGGYLAHLLGWQSLVAGTLVLVFMTPVNIYAARKYSLAQQLLMSTRDRKIKVLTEVMHLIRQIKFSAQESRWEAIIEKRRQEELRAQWTTFFWSIAQIAVYLATPVVLSVVCLGTHALIYKSLSAPVAFSAIAVLSSIEIVMYALPECVARTATGLNSLKRIEQHLDSSESNYRLESDMAVKFFDATIGWNSASSENPVRSILHSINLSFPPSKLSLVTGATGSGKSLLLASILGESTLISGSIRGPRNGKYAYVAQVPWLANASIKENILFGNSLDTIRYNEVLYSCALQQDLLLFPDGDSTEVGPSGVNLSGGQKWRLSLARALYSPADILVMDDIFSAVDVHTASHLFTYALTGSLAKDRTRILVTHHVSLCLSRTEYIVSLEQGSVQYAGPVLNRHVPATDVGEQKEAGLSSANDPVPDEPQNLVDDDFNAHRPNNSPSQFVEEEKREEGTLQWRVWKAYLAAGGGMIACVWVVATFGGYSMVLTARAWWLHIWSDEEGKFPCDATESTDCVDDHLLFYLAVYIGLGAVVCVIGTVRSYFALKVALKSAKNLFHDLLDTILHTPLRWIDTVPPGRIMSRLIVDILVVDSQLGDDIQSVLANAFDMILAIAAGSIVNPWLMVPASFLCIVCVTYGRVYLNAAREIRRLESVLKSSVFEHVRATLSGLWTIRAENKTATYVTKVTEQVDRYARAYWQLWLLNCWLAFRMDVLGAIFALVASVLVVSSPSVNAALAGFAISFALEMASSMSLTVRRYAGLELSMNSVERILEYTELETEPIHSGDHIPTVWPSSGCVDVSNLTVSYAPNLPPALHGITFRVGPAERVGVVGRTGSGKSSLILALFRFLEASKGSIVIDGLDISMLKLQQMRERLAIVPQDPAVFSGTVRTNLDPFNQYSDDELLAALRGVEWDDDLASTNSSPVKDDSFEPDDGPESFKNEDESSIPLMTIEDTTATQSPTSPTSPGRLLDYPIAADGQNLSQGRRQLLCLARAIVRRPKLLVLDEATSGIDELIDQKVQSSIRQISKLNSMSLLVVAHRLSTIVDFDRILVLDGGRVAEFGGPQELMQRPNGVFRAMMMESNGEHSKAAE